MYCVEKGFKKTLSISGIVCVVPVVIIVSISITMVSRLISRKPVESLSQILPLVLSILSSTPFPLPVAVTSAPVSISPISIVVPARPVGVVSPVIPLRRMPCRPLALKAGVAQAPMMVMFVAAELWMVIWNTISNHLISYVRETLFRIHISIVILERSTPQPRGF